MCALMYVSRFRFLVDAPEDTVKKIRARAPVPMHAFLDLSL